MATGHRRPDPHSSSSLYIRSPETPAQDLTAFLDFGSHRLTSPRILRRANGLGWERRDKNHPRLQPVPQLACAPSWKRASGAVSSSQCIKPSRPDKNTEGSHGHKPLPHQKWRDLRCKNKNGPGYSDRLVLHVFTTSITHDSLIVNRGMPLKSHPNNSEPTPTITGIAVSPPPMVCAFASMSASPRSRRLQTTLPHLLLALDTNLPARINDPILDGRKL